MAKVKRLLLPLLLLSITLAAHAQVDSTAIMQMTSMLEQYTAAIEDSSPAEKSAECDFLISSCTDTLLRSIVTAYLFDHYRESRVMGDEVISVGIYDRWIDSGLSQLSPEKAGEASAWVMLNRSSMVGERAPLLELETFEGQILTVPGQRGRQSVLYFYEPTCAKCQMEGILLSAYLSEVSTPLTVYTIYMGSDRDQWAEYIEQRWQCSNPSVEIVNCWDPQMSSDYVRKYAAISSPTILVVDEQGIIRGRRLEVEALRQVIALGAIRGDLYYSRAAVGTRIADMSIPASRVNGKDGTSEEGLYSLRKVGGRHNYIVFYTPGCEHCQEQLAAVRQALGRRDRALLVNIDELILSHRELASELFDTFDLTLMPHIIKTDKRGKILDKYLDF